MDTLVAHQPQMAGSLGKKPISLMSCKKSLADTYHPTRRVYGRRKGRPLRKSQAEAFDTLLPVLSVPEDLLREDAAIEIESLFSKPFEQYCMEIGFGGGEHLTALLQQFPDIGFLGAEPFLDGMATFLRDITPLPHDNIRVHMDDAMLLVHSLTDNCLDKIYVLNPDPWPKTRHHKRRIINQKNLSAFARILKPGGTLIMATDVDDLAEWMVTQCMMHKSFEWSANAAKDWQTPPPEWIETRYAFKGRSAGRNQIFLVFTLVQEPETE